MSSNLLELGDDGDAGLLHEESRSMLIVNLDRDSAGSSSLSGNEEDMKKEFDIKNLNFSSGYTAQYHKFKNEVEAKCMQLYMFLDQFIDKIPFHRIEEYSIKLFTFLKERLPIDSLFYGIMGLIFIVFLILISESSPRKSN